MSKISDTIYSCLRLMGLTVALFAMAAASGCISAKSRPAADAEPATPAQPLTPAVPAAEASDISEAPESQLPGDDEATDSMSESGMLTSWIVAKGEHLWGISSVEEVYNHPLRWPLLYKYNLDQIVDADLIYPGQVLGIPRDLSQSEIDTAVNHAKTRGAWALGPVELSDRDYLRR